MKNVVIKVYNNIFIVEKRIGQMSNMTPITSSFPIFAIYTVDVTFCKDFRSKMTIDACYKWNSF